MSRQETAGSIVKHKAEAKTAAKKDSFCCHKCGFAFEKPIFAVNNSPGVTEGYYACPFCLSKINGEGEEEQKPIEDALDVPAQEEQTVTVKDKKIEIPRNIDAPPTVCPHEFGYLKKRPKNTPVPEACFTCTRMLDCMTC